MKSLFSKRKGMAVIAVAVAIALISIITMSLSSGNSDVISGTESVMMKPVRSLMTALVQSLEKIYGYMYKYDLIVEENKQLKAEIAELEEEYRDYAAISDENEQLRNLLGLSSRHSDFKYESATIISWTASNWSSTFTLGKGSSSGIELYDCVVTDNGYLVGQVTELGSTTATVTTILDTSSDIGALVYSSSEVAVIEGDYKLLQEGMVKLSYLADTAAVATGDTIVTSGMGGMFPQGLVIGYVENVYSTASGLAGYAAIKPAADIDGLTHVFVVTDFEVRN